MFEELGHSMDSTPETVIFGVAESVTAEVIDEEGRGLRKWRRLEKFEVYDALWVCGDKNTNVELELTDGDVVLLPKGYILFCEDLLPKELDIHCNLGNFE